MQNDLIQMLSITVSIERIVKSGSWVMVMDTFCEERKVTS